MLYERKLAKGRKKKVDILIWVWNYLLLINIKMETIKQSKLTYGVLFIFLVHLLYFFFFDEWIIFYANPKIVRHTYYTRS